MYKLSSVNMGDSLDSSSPLINIVQRGFKPPTSNCTKCVNHPYSLYDYYTEYTRICNVYIYIYIHTHTHIYIYIYMAVVELLGVLSM